MDRCPHIATSDRGARARLAAWIRAAAAAAAVALATAGGPAAASPPPAPEPSAASAFNPALGNRLALVEGGYDALLLRVHLIREARRSIDIQTFIWTNDECGRLLICELVEAARRGVRVRILADHFVSDKDPETMAFLATIHPNLEVKHYRPALSRLRPALWRTVLAGAVSFRSFNQRMHNKVMLFDDTQLLTGGRNVENTYFDHATGLNFRDRDVLAIGPVVHAAVESFAHFWAYRHSVPSRALKDVESVVATGKFRRYETRADYEFGPHFTTLDRDLPAAAARILGQLRPVRHVVFVADEPGKVGGTTSGLPRSTQELRRALEQAKREITMQTPYLVLSRPARAVLRDAHARNPGLRVRISTNSFASTDNLFAYSANYRLRNDYVEDLGLLIHEYKPRPAALPALFPRHEVMAQVARERTPAGRRPPNPFLCVHAKSLVVDGRLAYVGSYNLDPRSENLNSEVGLLVEDEAFAEQLRAQIETDLRPENSWVIARRVLPLGLDVVNGLVDRVLSLSPVDLWPVQNTTSFELLPGAEPVPPGHPDFFRRHRDVGPFPGTDGLLSTKEILTRLYKAVGSPLTPIL